MPAGSASIPAMLLGKLALLVLALFGAALVARFLLGLRSFQRRHNESAGPARERFREQVERARPLPGGPGEPCL